MKTRAFLQGTALAMTLTIIAASAQTEQWLQYRLGGTSHGSRWLDLSTNPPPGVSLPSLGAQPLFARWTTPLDPRGRWIALDRTRKTGPPNRLFVDRDGDGRLDNELPVTATRADSYSAVFEPVRLVFQSEDGPSTYHLLLRAMRYSEDDHRLLASSGCAARGRVTFGSKKLEVTLVDRNVNGTFDDVSENPAECDGLLLAGDAAGLRLLGRWLEVQEQLFVLEVARDGAFLKVTPARDVPLGRVRLPETITEFTAVGPPGHFLRKPAKGELTLPAGRYRVYGWTTQRKDDQGATWSLAGRGFDEFAAFEVSPDQLAALDLGEPVVVALTVAENRGGATFGLKLKGRLGETVDLLKGRERPRAPRLLLASQSGGFRATNNFEYG